MEVHVHDLRAICAICDLMCPRFDVLEIMAHPRADNIRTIQGEGHVFFSIFMFSSVASQSGFSFK